MARSGDIDKDAAYKTAQTLAAQGSINVAYRPSTGLRIPIESVTENALREVQDIIEYEEVVATLPKDNSLTTIEKATLNIEMIERWIDENTWLNQYLDRTGKTVVLYIPPINRLYRTLIIASAITVVGLVGTMDFWNHQTVALRSNEVLLQHGFIPKYLCPSYIQEEWDRGNKWPARILASMNRLKAARKLLRTIR